MFKFGKKANRKPAPKKAEERVIYFDGEEVEEVPTVEEEFPEELALEFDEEEEELMEEIEEEEEELEEEYEEELEELEEFEEELAEEDEEDDVPEDDDDIDYAEEYEQRRAAIMAEYDAQLKHLQKMAAGNPAQFGKLTKAVSAKYKAKLAALDDEYEFEEVEVEPAPKKKKKEDNPFAYDKVQAMTDDMNVLAREGIGTVRELKGAYDDMKELLDFKSWLK